MESAQVNSANEQINVKDSLSVSNSTEKDNDPTLALLNTFAQNLQKKIEGNLSFGSRKEQRWKLQVDKIGDKQYAFKSYDCQTKFTYDGKTVAINSLLKWNASEIDNAFRVMNVLNSTIYEHEKNPNGLNMDYSDGKKFMLDGNSIVSWFNIPESTDSTQVKQKYFDLALINKRLPQSSDKKAQNENMKFLLDYLNSH